MLTQIATLLLDIPTGFHVRAVEVQEATLTLFVMLKRRHARCPRCNRRSFRIHSHYERTLADVPAGSKRLTLRVQVRRFFCEHPACPRHIFAERLAELALPRQRRTARLAQLGQRIAYALGGNAGARLCDDLNTPISASTLLRQLLRTPISSPAILSAVGIDDWAFKKGRTYGTIVVDLHTGKTVDLLPDRERETVSAWLQKHPEIQIVSRDRNASYADAIRTGAPQAQQVADRWHLLHNLAEVLERLLLRHRSCLDSHESAFPKEEKEAGASSPQSPALPEPQPPCRPLSVEERERQARRQDKQEQFAQVQALAAQGMSQRAIARQVGLHRVTVRNWLGTNAPPQRPSRSTVRQEHRDFVRKHWEQGETDLKALHVQLKANGFTGSYSALYRAARHLRLKTPVSPPPTRRISPRSAACRLLLLPEKRELKDERLRQKIMSASEMLGKAVELADRFATMLRKRQQAAFAVWLQDCQQSGIGEFVSFARSLLQDKSAVEAALSSEWSNAAAEGNVNRLKLIKRQMYGRASFALLRARVLHYP
jgi:transposase